jgi:hypothetical protein
MRAQMVALPAALCFPLRRIGTWHIRRPIRGTRRVGAFMPSIVFTFSNAGQVVSLLTYLFRRVSLTLRSTTISARTPGQ